MIKYSTEVRFPLQQRDVGVQKKFIFFLAERSDVFTNINAATDKFLWQKRFEDV